MNKTTLIASVAVIGAALATYKYHQIHFNIIVKRFPNLDRKVVKEAYKTMMKRALEGAYRSMDDSEETMDKIFLAIVKEQSASN